jgi:hypothetical protein
VTVGRVGTIALAVAATLATASVVVAIASDATLSTVLVASVVLAATDSLVLAGVSATAFEAVGAECGGATIALVATTGVPAVAVTAAVGGATARGRTTTFACADA